MDVRTQSPLSPPWRLVLSAAAAAALTVGIVASPSRYAAAEERPVVWKRLSEVAIDERAKRVARSFIVKAGFRTNIAASWKLVDRTYPGRALYTKATWGKGDVPVRPVSFPVADLRAMRFHAVEALDDTIWLDVALAPRRGRPDRFGLGLRRRGQSWFVDSWESSANRPSRRSNPN